MSNNHAQTTKQLIMKNNQNIRWLAWINLLGKVAGISPMTVALVLIASGAGPVGTSSFAATKAVVDTSASPNVKFRPIDLDAARWTGGFWGERWELNRRVTLPTMKEVMELPNNYATFQNLRLAAGEVQGKFFGNNWSDGDCYKWIEAAASVYALTRDPELDRQMDEVIAVIAKAQAPDGYISTQIQLSEKGRWTQLQHHELYNMGHLLTAACIHHRVTGKDNFLSVARKLADYLYTVFEPRPKELAHFCFNPSNIMGAAELYRTTGDKKYLRLAGIFVTMRGSQPDGSDQQQARVPLRKENEAVGHAVTAAYLWCGAADVCAETGEPALLTALQGLWDDVTSSKMYITGGTAALHHGESHRDKPNPIAKNKSFKLKPDSVHEAFGMAYQLPNRTAYNETCANIANAMWNWRMLLLTGEAKYADVMERVFYNSMLSAIGLEGKDYFYTNPLRRGPKDVPLLSQDSASRWPNTTPTSPVHCFCCPPSLARTIAQLHTYAYGLSADGVWIHLYGSGRLDAKLPDGAPVSLSQQTDFPWDGRITIRLEKMPQGETALRLRIPSWVSAPTVKINGQPATETVQPGSYCELRRRWSAGDTVELDLPMPVVLLESHPLVEENRNHVAVMRGPLVYCLEDKDLPPGVAIENVRIDLKAKWKVRHDANLLHAVTVLESQGTVVSPASEGGTLYRRLSVGSPEAISLRLIPYYAWSNRGESQMSVWLPVR